MSCCFGSKYAQSYELVPSESEIAAQKFEVVEKKGGKRKHKTNFTGVSTGATSAATTKKSFFIFRKQKRGSIEISFNDTPLTDQEKQDREFQSAILPPRRTAQPSFFNMFHRFSSRQLEPSSKYLPQLTKKNSFNQNGNSLNAPPGAHLDGSSNSLNAPPGASLKPNPFERDIPKEKSPFDSLEEEERIKAALSTPSQRDLLSPSPEHKIKSRGINIKGMFNKNSNNKKVTSNLSSDDEREAEISFL